MKADYLRSIFLNRLFFHIDILKEYKTFQSKEVHEIHHRIAPQQKMREMRNFRF